VRPAECVRDECLASPARRRDWSARQPSRLAKSRAPHAIRCVCIGERVGIRWRASACLARPPQAVLRERHADRARRPELEVGLLPLEPGRDLTKRPRADGSYVLARELRRRLVPPGLGACEAHASGPRARSRPSARAVGRAPEQRTDPAEAPGCGAALRARSLVLRHPDGVPRGARRGTQVALPTLMPNCLFPLRSFTMVSLAAASLLACTSVEEAGEARQERSSRLADDAPARTTGPSSSPADACTGLGLDDCTADPACASFTIRCEQADAFGACPFVSQCAPRSSDLEGLPVAPSCSPSVCQAWAAGLVTRAPRLPPVHETSCVRSGCNGERCVERGRDVVTACVVDAASECLREATCEPQAGGECGFTLTDEQKACLERPGPSSG
jgi:hypothetical protein